MKRYRAKRPEEEATRAAINREVEVLARAWSLAQKYDPPKVNRPFHFPMFEENNVRTGFLDDEQFQALQYALPGYLKPLLLVGYHVPCRLGELVNLLVKQLDFKEKEIVLNPGETKNRDGAPHAHVRTNAGMLLDAEIDTRRKVSGVPLCVLRRGGIADCGFPQGLGGSL
jgi:integrase